MTGGYHDSADGAGMHHGASTDDENVMESAAILDGIFLNEGISIAVVTGTPPV